MYVVCKYLGRKTFLINKKNQIMVLIDTIDTNKK